jgi:uncharacterized protein with HEPN domain
MTRTELTKNNLVFSAVQKKLEIIGEATKRLSPGFHDSLPKVPWRDMADIRDRLVHRYQEIDINIIWVAMQKKVPQPIETLGPLCPPSPDERQNP